MSKPSGKLWARDDDKGKPVDWWFMYKLPEGVGSGEALGFNYLYCDSNATDGLALSEKTLDQGTSALHNTLSSVFDSDAGYLLYNDESPMPDAKDSGARGHCKGMLAWDMETNTAILLTHSTPRFPHPDQVELPEMERKYGQTYLCISLENVSTAEQLANQLMFMHSPQVYAHRFQQRKPPSSSVHRLSQQDFEKVTGQAGTLEFHSRKKQLFRSLCKNKQWKKDFWMDLVSPTLRTDLLVESWVRGAMPPDEYHGEEIEDVLELDFSHLGLENTRWKETQDHAKWAVSIDELRNEVCVGDLNRMISQEKRGGGTIAFACPGLWKDLFQAHVHLHEKASELAKEAGGTPTTGED